MKKLLPLAALALASCSHDLPDRAPGVQIKEAVMLERTYYFKRGSAPLTYSDDEVRAVFQEYAKPLNGVKVKVRASRLVMRLCVVGDTRFAHLLHEQPDAIQKAAAPDLTPLWRGEHLRYPKTEALVSKISHP